MQNIPTLPSQQQLQPKSSTVPKTYVAFLHPGYEAPNNVLFKLPRVAAVPHSAAPSTESAASTYGVHHATALVACQIVANNAFDGFLSCNSEGTRPVCVGADQDDNDNTMLYDNKYYFVVPDSTHAASESDKNNEPYAIVPSFEDWPFPHGYIPPLWRPIDNNISIGGGGVYPRCVVSDNTWSVNKCHLIPNCKKLWFDKNGMSQYGSSCLGINDPDNMCILRQDIHNGLDSFIFAFVPKRHGYVVHALQVYGPWPEFTAEFHDVPFRGVINVEYLFARFAYAVFMLIKTFVTNSRISRRVARHLECSDEGPSMNFETKIEWIAGKKLDDSYAGGKSRSSSPRKRAKGDSNDLQTLQQQYGHRFGCDDTSMNRSSTDRSLLISDSQESMNEIEVLKTPIDTPGCYDVWDELSEGYGQWEDEEPRGRTRKRDSSVSDYEEDQGRQKRRAMQSVIALDCPVNSIH